MDLIGAIGRGPVALDTAIFIYFMELLTRGRGLTVVSIDTSLVRLAAQIRAATSVRMPDALQLAAALSRKCTAFLTNDKRVPALPGLEVLVLDSFAPA